MNGLLTNSQISSLTGQFNDLFTTLSTQSDNFISIVKQPTNIINNPSENVLAGFGGEAMNPFDITYQPVTGVFPAMIIYPHSLKSEHFGQLKFDLDENSVLIKVPQSTRDYIVNGKTEKIIVDNLTYGTIEISPTTQNFFTLKYYYFKLSITK